MRAGMATRIIIWVCLREEGRVVQPSTGVGWSMLLFLYRYPSVTLECDYSTYNALIPSRSKETSMISVLLGWWTCSPPGRKLVTFSER